MVDLQRQYQVLKPEIDAAIAQVLQTTRFIKGDEVKLFENQLAAWIGSKHVISCANGTDALQIAMMALELKPGDEVITTGFTYVATAEVLALLGLVPVLIETDEKYFTMNVEELEAAITSKTRAIVPVHLFGQSANMEAIMKVATKHNLFVVEDNAQAIGAEYRFDDGSTKKAGTIGHIGTTSFFPSKNLGCYGDGGALFTDDENLAIKIRMIANHGQSTQYVHDIIGINSRLDTLQAAILLVKLKYLTDYNHRRLQNALYYSQSLMDIVQLQTPQIASYSSHVFHQYTLKVNEQHRDRLKQYLAEHDIPSMIYYPKPLHHQKAFGNAVFQADNLKLTEQLCRQVLSLPMSPDLDKEQQDYIIYHIKNYFNT